MLNSNFLQSSAAIPVLNISILVVSSLTAIFFFREKINMPRILGLALAVIAILLIAWGGQIAKSKVKSENQEVWGVIQLAVKKQKPLVMGNIDKYKTIAAPSTSDFRDRGSKFLAFAYPVFSLQDIKDRLHDLKKEHPKAVHHCYAFRLGTDGMQYRASDDGEPAGSAGKPILGQIDSLGLTNVLVVVVRYFGGTLLGIPGLINAYKTAAFQALEPLPKTEKWIEDLFEINFDYPVMGEVLHLLKQNEATIYKQDMQLFCVIKAGIPRVYSDSCVKKLLEVRGVKVEGIND